ncbi:MAG: GtrA family protein [Atopobiaceae bacterium]|nr:GtrA family protein [Atopobiaceae bacterium]
MDTEKNISLGRFGRFACSSLASTAVDQLVAWALFAAFRGLFVGADFLRILIATVIARCVSMALNFTINRRVVFSQEDPAVTRDRHESMQRFILLEVGILCLSSMGVWAAHMALGTPEWQAKPMVDLALFFLNYTGQRKWVFIDQREAKRIALA